MGDYITLPGRYGNVRGTRDGSTTAPKTSWPHGRRSKVCPLSLSSNCSNPRNMRITHSGFAFLLQDINAQIWTLLLQYLEYSTKLKMDPVHVLHFLFMLGSLELGQDYSTSMLTDTQHIMLEDLRDYGIVFQRKVTHYSCHPDFRPSHDDFIRPDSQRHSPLTLPPLYQDLDQVPILQILPNKATSSSKQIIDCTHTQIRPFK